MAFEEIKAKLGLDITAFEKGMLDANRAAKQAAAAQAKLADFRRAKALEEASDLERIKILQGELVQLYNVRKSAVAGSAPYLQAQLEIEKKMVEIGKVRAQQKANEAQAQQAAAKAAAQTAAASAKPLPQVEQNKGIGGLFKGATDKLLNLQVLGNTVATALGLNIQSIAEGVARFIVGFSQTQEDALNRLVDRSKAAADELTQIANKRRAGDDPQKRIDLLNDEEASLRLVAQGTAKLTAAEKYRILLREGPFTAGAVVAREEEILAKQIEDATNRIGQIGRERLVAEDDLKKKNAENEKKSTEEVAKNFAAAAEERKKRTLDQMSDEDKLKALQEEQTQALKDYNDTSKTAGQRSEAKAKSEKLATEIQKTTNDIAKKATDSANERLSLEEEINKTKEDTAKIGKTDAELLADMEDKLFRLKQERDRTTDKDDRLKITLEIAKKEQEIKKAKQDALDVTTAETTEIFDRIKKLKKEKVDATKPTPEDIATGKRKAPFETKQLVKDLKKNQDQQIKANDAVRFANVAYSKALKEGTTSEKRKAKAELDSAKFNFEQLGKQEQKIKEELVGQGVNIGEELIPQEPKKPEIPQEPKDPKKPEIPQEPNKPEIPQEPKDPKKPEIPQEPNKPEIPQEPNKPEIPQEPKKPEIPQEPKDPKKPEIPQEPKKPEAIKPTPQPKILEQSKPTAQPVPVPQLKPTPQPNISQAPIMAAQAALTAAQGQVQQAQNQLTNMPKAAGADLSGILGNINKGISDLNTKLESTAIK